MKMTLKKNILFICSLTLAIGSTAYGDIYSEAVKNIKMEELANTYSCKKINEVLKDYKNSKDKYKAVLVDMGAISVDDLNKNKNIEEKINLFVSDYIDTTENYIGNVSDKNIIERVQNKWNNSKVIKDSKLIGYLNNAVVKGLTTGYNLKNKNDYANFNNFQSLTLSYGHNDIVHASQIIALMKSENIDAKVQLEPKTSAFIYLKEWGEPSYVCSKMDDGTIIAHPLEYDLKFEFSTAKDKQRFCDMIEKYAKKDSEDEEGLLFESWWQPFMQEIRMETVDGDTKIFS